MRSGLTVLLVVAFMIATAGAANYMYEKASVKGVGYKNVEMIVSTADALADWAPLEQVAGEGDESAGAVRSVYRYLRGTYTAEPGQMATSSLIVGWSDDEATYVFQFVVTGWRKDAAVHDDAMSCLLLGEWTAAQIIDAMRG